MLTLLSVVSNDNYLGKSVLITQPAHSFIMPEELRYGTFHKIQTTYLLKRGGEDKMTWGEKVGNNKRAIIK